MADIKTACRGNFTGGFNISQTKMKNSCYDMRRYCYERDCPLNNMRFFALIKFKH